MEISSNMSTSKSESDKSLAQKFYGSSVSDRSWSECVLHLRKTYKELQSKPIPSVFKSRLEGPSVVWKVFMRLSEAASYADSCTKECMIFSFEKRNPDSAGQRMFLVTHPHHMWLNHKSRPPDFRCSYEVIRESFPCKLYFDLEFNKNINSSKDGNNLTHTFMKCVAASMLEVFNIRLQTFDILWLDASTEFKFSAHLIIQDSNVIFENNVAAGSFVSLLFSKIIYKITNNAESDDLWPSAEELKSLFIQKSDEKSVLFCDSGVYTKNRNFRLYLSTKYGKNSPLLVSPYNQFTPASDSSHKDKDELLFYDSLITYFRNNKKNKKTLPNILPNMNAGVSSHITAPNSKQKCIGITQCGPSIFPEIDDFILTQVRDIRTTGFIRKGTYLEREEILVYEIGNYRFCSNIGRHHKSNNIMIVVDMKSKQYYQKCHDPECRAQNYKSTPQQLPASLYTLPEEFFDENCFSQLNSKPIDTCLNNDSITGSDHKLIPNLTEDMIVDDLFFEEPFSFTQTNNSSELEKMSELTNLNSVNKSFSSSDNCREYLLEDSCFHEMFTDDFEDLVKGSSSCKENSIACDYSNDHRDTNKDTLAKEQSPDYVTAEDEMLMSEAADALECSFLDNDDLFDEL